MKKTNPTKKIFKKRCNSCLVRPWSLQRTRVTRKPNQSAIFHWNEISQSRKNLGKRISSGCFFEMTVEVEKCQPKETRGELVHCNTLYWKTFSSMPLLMV